MTSQGKHSQQGSAEPPVGANRRRLVESAQKVWIQKLIDLSRRNSLLYFKHWKLASAELPSWDLPALYALLAGEQTALVDLMPSEHQLNRKVDRAVEEATIYAEDADDEFLNEHAGLLPKLFAIARKAWENYEERGMETMYLAYGMASWKSDDAGRNPESPVLLLPVSLEGVGRKRALMPRGDLEPNFTLLLALEQLGCPDLGQQLEDLLADGDLVAAGTAVADSMSLISGTASYVPEFRIDERVVIANFSFEKLAMVKDLQANLDPLCRNDIIAALAGDVEAVTSLRRTWDANQVAPSDLDRLPPKADLVIASADSSQHSAITTIVRGQSGVISGPPGTGKSQTITNLIGSLVSEGKSVLFVAEKRAALEVVKRRLEAAGLQHLVLDLHGRAKKRLKSCDSLLRVWTLFVEAVPSMQRL